MANTTIRKSASATVVFGSGATVRDLLSAFANVPGEAVLSVEHWKGDQREPAQTTITARWDI